MVSTKVPVSWIPVSRFLRLWFSVKISRPPQSIRRGSYRKVARGLLRSSAMAPYQTLPTAFLSVAVLVVECRNGVVLNQPAMVDIIGGDPIDISDKFRSRCSITLRTSTNAAESSSAIVGSSQLRTAPLASNPPLRSCYGSDRTRQTRDERWIKWKRRVIANC